MAIEEVSNRDPILRVVEQGSEQSPSVRGRIVRLVGGLALAGVAGAAVFGVGTMAFVPAQTKVGPHEADAYLTTDSIGSLDIGFLGSLNEPVQLGGFGVRVDVHGVQNEGTGAEELVSQQNTDKYIQLLSDPERDQAQVRSALKNHFIEGTAPAGALLGASIFGAFYVAMGPDTRRRRVEQMRNGPAKWVALGVFATAVAGVGIWGAHQINQAEQRSGNLGAAFNGTGLQDVYAEGSELKYIVRTYGTYLAEGEKFEQTVKSNLKLANEQTPIITASQTTKTVLFEAGMKCNNVVAMNTAAIYNVANPNLLISAGDMAGTGTPLDSQCIETLAFRIKGKKLIAPGNHDSNKAIQTMDENGFKILDGNIVNEAGLRVLGVINPRESIPLAGKRPRAGVPSSETTTTLSSKLATLACNDKKGVDIAIANEPRVVSGIHGNSCAKLVISAVRGEHLVDVDQPQIMLASSSGADDGEINLGPPHSAGEWTLVEFDRETHQPRRYQIVRVEPDGSVDIGLPELFNAG